LTHDADKLIRQLSLVAYLMAEQRPVTARDVKANVEGYADMKDEAFARRFYADRAELQTLGIPVGSHRDEFTGDEIYTLREEAYFLPPIDLSDAELAALQTSLHLLEGQFAYAEPLRLALQNLALGRGHATADPGPRTATVDLLGPAYTPEVAARLAKLENAISKQRTVRFTYWTIGKDSEGERVVNPYGLYELDGRWYLVGDDLAAGEDEQRRKTFRVSRIRGEIRFATRRERDFRMPADFDVTAYRDRAPWRLAGDAGAARAVVRVDADATWLVRRLHGAHGEIEEGDDGHARFTTDYTDEAALAGWILAQGGHVLPLEPPALVDRVAADLAAIADAHRGEPRAVPAPAPDAPDEPEAPAERGPGPVAPERFALLQALLAYLLERCGEEESTEVTAAELESRFHLNRRELQEHLDLLNLVNFGGGCYAVYCRTRNGAIHVDKELYGDTFRRPARLSPLEAKALLRALDVVAPLVAAEADTSLDAVRAKVEAAFGEFRLADTPAPHGASEEEAAVSTLNDGVRERRLVRMMYLSRSSDELSERVIEPYLLRRDEKGWYVEAWDMTRGGRRTFKVSYIQSAALLDEGYTPRPEMRDLDASLGGEVGVATVWFSPERARWELEGRRDIGRLPGGAALARIAFGSREWLVPEILRYRGQAEVLAPEWVRDEVAAAAERLHEHVLAGTAPGVHA
jgi:proteasome accessory factor BC